MSEVFSATEMQCTNIKLKLFDQVYEAVLTYDCEAGYGEATKQH